MVIFGFGGSMTIVLVATCRYAFVLIETATQMCLQIVFVDTKGHMFVSGAHASSILHLF